MSKVYYKNKLVFEGTCSECADFVATDCLGSTADYNIYP